MTSSVPEVRKLCPRGMARWWHRSESRKRGQNNEQVCRKLSTDKENAGEDDELGDTSMMSGRGRWRRSRAKLRDGRRVRVGPATGGFRGTNLGTTTFRDHAHGHGIHIEGQLRCILDY